MAENPQVARYRNLIEIIMEWADEKDRGFDTTFVEQMQDMLEHGALTARQEQAIDNIIERWRIEI